MVVPAGAQSYVIGAVKLFVTVSLTVYALGCGHFLCVVCKFFGIGEREATQHTATAHQVAQTSLTQ